MKNSIFSVSLIAFVFVLTSFAPAAKIKYTSAEGKLSMKFPVAFKSVTKEAEDHKSVETQASFEDQLYFVSYTIHKVKMENHESLAATSLESFNEAMSGTITKQATWAIKKHKGLQADIEIPGNNMRVEYRVLLIGQIQYQIVVISEVAKWNQLRADEFIKSFKVKE
jgi:hypothetical protein